MKNEPFSQPPNSTLSWIWYDDRQELLLLPAGLYVWGLVKGDIALIGVALAIWTVAYGLWSAWTLWRFIDVFPRDDDWRAVSILVFGGAAWLAVPLLFVIDDRLGASLSFPVVYVPGCVALIAARRRGVVMSQSGRRRMVGGAAILCGIWVLTLAALAGFEISIYLDGQAGFLDFLLTSLCAALMLLAGGLGFALGRSAIAGFTPRRPIIAAPP